MSGDICDDEQTLLQPHNLEVDSVNIDFETGARNLTRTASHERAGIHCCSQHIPSWHLHIAGIVLVLASTGLVVTLPVYLQAINIAGTAYSGVLFVWLVVSACTALYCYSRYSHSFLWNCMGRRSMTRAARYGCWHGLSCVAVVYSLDRKRVLCHVQEPLMGLTVLYMILLYCFYRGPVLSSSKLLCLCGVLAGLFLAMDFQLNDSYLCRGRTRDSPASDGGPWTRQQHALWTIVYAAALFGYTLAWMRMEQLLLNLDKHRQSSDEVNTVSGQLVLSSATSPPHSSLLLQAHTPTPILQPHRQVPPPPHAVSAPPSLHNGAPVLLAFAGVPAPPPSCNRASAPTPTSQSHCCCTKAEVEGAAVDNLLKNSTDHVESVSITNNSCSGSVCLYCQSKKSTVQLCSDLPPLLQQQQASTASQQPPPLVLEHSQQQQPQFVNHSSSSAGPLPQPLSGALTMQSQYHSNSSLTSEASLFSSVSSVSLFPSGDSGFGGCGGVRYLTPPKLDALLFWFVMATLAAVLALFWTDFFTALGKSGSAVQFANLTSTGLLCHFCGLHSCGPTALHGWSVTLYLLLFLSCVRVLCLSSRSIIFPLSVASLALPLSAIFWGAFSEGGQYGIVWAPMITGELVFSSFGLPVMVACLVCWARLDRQSQHKQSHRAKPLTRSTRTLDNTGGRDTAAAPDQTEVSGISAEQYGRLSGAAASQCVCGLEGQCGQLSVGAQPRSCCGNAAVQHQVCSGRLPSPNESACLCQHQVSRVVHSQSTTVDVHDVLGSDERLRVPTV